MKNTGDKLKSAGLVFSGLVLDGVARVWRSAVTPVWKIVTRCAVFLLATVLAGARRIKAGIIKIVSNHSFIVELKAAVFIASVVAILEHNHLLEGLQQDNLQLALPFLQTLAPAAPNANIGDSDIKAILIDDLTYENRFRQESPLDRQELSTIIGRLLQEKPSVLVIDLDLSPGLPADNLGAIETETIEPQATSGISERTNNWSKAEIALYSLLKHDRWNSVTEIILSTPIPVFDPALAKVKADWMKAMCSDDISLGRAKIHFGLPHIPVVSGVPLRYDRGPSALAVEVSHAALRSANPHALCGQDDLIRYTRKYADVQTNEEMESDLLNYRFASAIQAYDISEACPAGNNCSGAGIAGSVVFFGGRYSPSDIYSTPVGVLSGVMLHAGSYYSITQPIGKTNVVVSYLLDIMMGCALGMIIYKLASLYRNQRSIGSIAMNLAVQPLFPYFMVVVSGLLLAHFNLWLNPAPMIFGIAIHAGLVRIEEPYIEDVADQKLLGISETRIKQVVYCVVVLIAWFYLADEMKFFE